MTTKLKILLADKIYPHLLNKNVMRNVRSLYMSRNGSSSAVIPNKINDLKDDSTNSQVNIDRDTFIKNVISDITTNKQHLKPKPQKIVMDFSSPNIAKPFHAGHLRSTIIGNFIANIHKYFNDDVTKINYLGDWGTQFGLLQYGLQENNVDINKLKNNPVKYLYEVYVHVNKLAANDETIQSKARQYFSDIEQGSADLTRWKMIRELTIEELDKVYKRLGIQFDDYHWESNYNGGAIKDVITLLKNKNIIQCDEEGKKVAKVKDRDVTVLKSDNSTLYLTRDIAALLDRYNRYKFNKMLYIVDNAQTDHFATVFNIVKQIDEKCTIGAQHVKFGRIKGMSTRSGNVVFLNDILDEAKRKMYNKQKSSKNTRNSAMNEETCDTLGITAVIINDLKQRRQNNYVFDWDRALQSEGDSGIKLQYLHCRLWSLEQNCGVSLPTVCDPKYLQEEIITIVVAELGKFNDVLERSIEEYEACIVVNYLFRLARHVNRMFNELKVKNVEGNLAAQRLLVYHSARLVVKTGLEILGVKPLEQM